MGEVYWKCLNLREDSETLKSSSKTYQSIDKLTWIKSVSERTYCISRGQSEPFLKFRYSPSANEEFTLQMLFHQTPKAQEHSSLSEASSCAEQRSAPDILKCLVSLFSHSIEMFCKIFEKKLLSNLKKVGVLIRLTNWAWILSQRLTTVKKQLTRDQQVMFDYYFEKKSSLCNKNSVSFSGRSLSDVSCFRLWHIEHGNSWRKTQYLKKTSRYTFAACFNGAKPEKRTIDCTKKTLIFFKFTHNLWTTW